MKLFYCFILTALIVATGCNDKRVNDVITAPPTPALSAMNANTGQPGDTLVLTGDNLTDVKMVLFDQNSAQIVSKTNTQIKVVVPAGSGYTRITVQNGNLISNYLTFTYGDAFSAYRVLTVGGVTYNVDTTAYFQIGPGAYYMALDFKNDAAPLKVFFVKVDATNPNITFRPVYALDSVSALEKPSAMAIRKSSAGNNYIAGTNADFFIGSGFSRNAFLTNGMLSTLPDSTKYTFDSDPVTIPGNIIFDAQNTMAIDAMQYAANVKIGAQQFNIDSLNFISVAGNKMTLFNEGAGAFTGTDNARTEVAVVPVSGTWSYGTEMDFKVVSIYTGKGNNPIPAGGAVLSGNGTAATALNTLAVNGTLKLNLSFSPKNVSITPAQIIGGRQIIMKGSNILTEFYNGNQIHPRTAMGYSNGGKTVYFCVIDGRSTISAGVTTSMLADIMKNFGATDAVNLDGGGSSTMYLKSVGVVNVPSDGSERAVSNGIFAVSKAPADNTVAALAAKQYVVRLIRNATFTPTIYALNKYGEIVSTPLIGLKLSASEGLGTFSGSTFKAGTSVVNGYITASYGNLTAKIKVIMY